MELLVHSRHLGAAWKGRSTGALVLAGVLVAGSLGLSTSALAQPRSHPSGSAQAQSQASTPSDKGAPSVHRGDDPCPSPAAGSGWELSTTTFANEYTRHAYVGNGYLSQRVPSTGTGYINTGEKTGWPLYTPRYTGAFVSGLYAADPALAEGRAILAAIPTWSTLAVTVGGETFDGATAGTDISNYRQTLYLRCGLLRTSLTWTTSAGKITELVYDVLADRNDANVGAVRVQVTPHWAGTAKVVDVIDGAGARRVVQTHGGRRGQQTMDVAFRTLTTNIDGAVASTLSLGRNVRPTAERFSKARDLTASHLVAFPVKAGRTYQLAKFVGVDTELGSKNPRRAATRASQGAARTGWDRLYDRHAASWQGLWQTGDIAVPERDDLQDWVRAGLYGLYSSVRAGEDDSIAPTGLTSDNYAGLIFWDAELWMYPALLMLHPELAKPVLDFRYRTMPGARNNAIKLGYQGLFYPWNGAGTGDLWSECHSWEPPHCITQIHLQGDISLAHWQYYQATKDTTWLRRRGWPVIRGIAEFWAGRVTANLDGSYSITNTAGPDEYSNGVDDAVFTNAVAAISLRNAKAAATELGKQVPVEWTTIADNLRMPFDEAQQVFMQYDGYDGSVIKQADTVLLLYPLEWPMTNAVATNTLDYYTERTDPDGPAMTDAVHAIAAAAIGKPGCSTNTYLMRSIRPFVRDPFGQFAEARGEKAGAADPLAGSPALHFLTGSGGFAQVFTNGLTGFRWRGDRLHVDPLLPPQLPGGIKITGAQWQGRTLDITVGPDATTLKLRRGRPVTVESAVGDAVLSKGAPLTVKTRRPDLLPTDNLARCQPAQASSEEPGLYAEAAVDGSHATAWALDEQAGSLTIDLGRSERIAKIAVSWTTTLPATWQILTSLDALSWTAATLGADGTLAPAVDARYIRVELTRAAPTDRVGIREVAIS